MHSTFCSKIILNTCATSHQYIAGNAAHLHVHILDVFAKNYYSHGEFHHLKLMLSPNILLVSPKCDDFFCKPCLLGFPQMKITWGQIRGAQQPYSNISNPIFQTSLYFRSGGILLEDGILTFVIS